MKTKVYIASPYTKGDVAVNVKRQMDMADQLMTLGYAPFAPLYSHFQHMAHPRPYADWIAIDLEWVPACDVLLRLDGESSGADGEVAFARERGIPVVFSVEQLRRCFPPYAAGVRVADGEVKRDQVLMNPGSTND
jgi:hypothetical protein